MLKVFYSYSHKDEGLRDKLETHLSMLKNAGYIANWHDRKIIPGEDWNKNIDTELETSDIVLLLISADFLASQYCYQTEVIRAIELHKQKKLVVIPVILRFCDWKLSHFEHLECLPTDAKPIQSKYWENEDFAFLNVVEGIKKTIIAIKDRRNTATTFAYISKIPFTIGGHTYYIDRYLLDNNTFIGIDFGTSTTVISVAKLDDNKSTVKIEPIAFDFKTQTHGVQKSNLIPSVLFYDVENQTLLSGTEAKMRKYAPDTNFGINYWTSFKMGLGKDVGSNYVNSVLKNIESSYQILNDKDAATVYFKTIKARIDKFIKEEKISENIKLSVSIPASFEANQRSELLSIVNQVFQISQEEIFIDEPNAAFLNFIQEGVNSKLLNLGETGMQHTLVFDFGAGTCDISILEFGQKNNGFYSRNIAISKFEQLGGDDIDKEIAKQILFKEFCEINEIDLELITDLEYKEIFEPKLKSPAESLKIKTCNKLKSLKEKMKKDSTIFCEESIVLHYKNQEYLYESQSTTFGQFGEVMNKFIEDVVENEYSIYYVINSALKKAKMNREDIDNILLIGGSCKNPLIENSLREKFKNVQFLLPLDLQLQVSKGAAIYSLLSNGINVQPIAPIVSESISILLYGNKHLNIIQQGEEIPHFKSIADQLTVQSNEQNTIEVPLFVSGKEKMLQKVVINSNKGFFKHDKIALSAEIDRNKVVTVKVLCNNKQLEVLQFSPFANEVLSPYKRAVKETEKEINNLLAKGVEKTDKLIRDLVDALIVYHTSMNSYKEAMETTIKFYPNRYSDISFYADAAGYEKISTEYAIKAFQANPNDTNAYNIALSFTEGSTDYNKYMKIACDLGNTSAKITIAIAEMIKGNENGRKQLQEPFDILFRSYQSKKSDLSISEIEDLLLAADYLGYTQLADEIDKFLIKRNQQLTSANMLFKEGNLLKEK